MASSQETQGQKSSSTPAASTDEPPLWEFVTKNAKQGTGGVGNSACKKTTVSDKTKMRKLEDAYEEKKDASKAKEVGLPCEANLGLKKRKTISNPIKSIWNPHFQRAFEFAATNKIEGYIPPSYNKLRTTLLQKEKENAHKLLEPIRLSWKEKGVSIVSDGWSDPTRKPLINFMATSGNGPLFIKEVNCFGEYKDKFFISNLMKEVINEIGHENVMQVITDNASVCKAAGELIMSEFPHIYWTLYAVHTLNLALKIFCSPKNAETNETTYDECHWINDIHLDAIAIKKFIMNHGMRLSIFSKFTPLKLLSIADTRFASIIVMLKRLKLLKRPLQEMVISEEWPTYREDGTVKASFVKEKVLDDE
ncbi:uncharacterized protein LOC143544012 [Bidens hawaiensis]|uniref:uncharacterized protein LOC143544012 n=1 Tax=Bidens hawaiensis TaxID=980011 RepID=UPI0040491550